MPLASNILTFLLGFFIAGVISGARRRQKYIPYLQGLLHSLGNTSGDGKIKEQDEDSADDVVQPGEVKLYTKADVEELFGEETWQRQAYERLKLILLASEPGALKYPCIYATAGYRGKEHRYIFTHSEDPREPRNIRLIANALRAYYPLSPSLDPNTSLVIVHPTSETQFSVQDYHIKFWQILRRLRLCDLRAWPKDVPEEINSPQWSFCFDGKPWFFAAMTPAHVKRQSRYAPNFIVAVQPKWVFDNFLKTPGKIEAATEAVRKLMPDYDDIAPHPDLSGYGAEGTTEANRYFLMDENVSRECPYSNLDQS